MTVFKKNTVLFIWPTILFLSLGLVIPLLFLFVTSFTNLELGFSQAHFSFVGVSNYVSLFTDYATFKSLSVTLSFVVLAVFVETLLGLCFALGMTATFKGQFIIKALLIVPMMIAPLVVGLVWRYLFDTRFGIINILLEYVGFSQPLWLADQSWAFISILITDIWQWTPFMFMILLAGLQGIPKNLIEAAKIDGLSWLQLILFIKIPYIKQLILFAMLLRITDAFKVLEVIFIMTFGGPGLATEVLSLHIYKIAFIGQQFGKAGALSLLFFTLSLLVSILLLKKKSYKK